MGNGAAYKQLKRTEDTLSDSILYFDRANKQRGVEDRAREEREGVRDDAKKKEWEDKWDLNIDDFQNQYTGFNNYDDVATDFSNHAISEYARVQRLASETTSPAEKRKYQNDLLKIKSGFKNFASGQKAYAELNAEYVKRAQEGKISAVDAERWENLMEETAVKFNVASRFEDPENGNYNLVHVTKDGIIPNVDLINGSIRPYDAQDIDGKEGVVQNILGRLGKNEIKDASGNIITNKQEFGTLQRKATNDYIESLMADDSWLADVSHQLGFNDKKKRKGFDADIKNKVKEKLTSLVEAGYDTKDEKSVNYQKLNFEDKGDEVKGTTSDITIMKGADGKPLQMSEDDPKKRIPNFDKKSTGFNLPNNFKFKGADVKSVFLSPDGKLTFVGNKFKKGEENKYTKEKITEDSYVDVPFSSETDANRMATEVKHPNRDGNFKDKKELIDYLKTKQVSKQDDKGILD